MECAQTSSLNAHQRKMAGHVSVDLWIHKINNYNPSCMFLLGISLFFDLTADKDEDQVEFMSAITPIQTRP